MKTFELPGGPAIVVADAPAKGGGTWNREGTILFVPDNSKGLYQAPSGRAAVVVLKLDRSKYSNFACPKFLPDGKHFLYYAWALDPTLSGTYFASLDGKENRLLLKGSGNLRLRIFALSARQNADGASFRSRARASQGGGSGNGGKGCRLTEPRLL